MSNKESQENSPGIFIQILRDATPFEMGLVSFVVFPAIFFAWNPILKELLPNQASLSTIILVVGYVGLVSLMLYGKVVAEQIKQSERVQEQKQKELKQKLEAAKNAIHSRLVSVEYTKSSYAMLRQKLCKEESEWSNDFLDTLVETYPTIFRYQRIKGGKPGLRLLDSIEVDED
jgi:hypothetical protein